MINRRTWQEFRDSGLLWWINMILHTFGWALILDMDDNQIKAVYPARVKFRGFNEAHNTEGYVKVSAYMAENASELEKETSEEE
jgi:hypothetical protein